MCVSFFFQGFWRTKTGKFSFTKHELKAAWTALTCSLWLFTHQVHSVRDKWTCLWSFPSANPSWMSHCMWWGGSGETNAPRLFDFFHPHCVCTVIYEIIDLKAVKSHHYLEANTVKCCHAEKQGYTQGYTDIHQPFWLLLFKLFSVK